jgi:FXSXX-COOH protein
LHREGVSSVMDATEDVATDLVDLSQMSLNELRSLDQPILSDALRRVVEEAKNSVEAIAGFQAVI